MRSSERRRSRAGTSASVKARKRRVSRSLISDSMLSGGCAGNACAKSRAIETLKKIARFIEVHHSREGRRENSTPSRLAVWKEFRGLECGAGACPGLRRTRGSALHYQARQ